MSATNAGSTFYDYDENSQVYSNTRVSVGLDLIKEKLSEIAEKTKRPVTELRILDAGAGTGNYATDLAKGVKEVVCVEFNDGMLSVLKKRAAEQGITNITAMKGSLFDKLPFDDKSFDVVICNQVVHHLDDIEVAKTGKYPMNTHVSKEFFRVLSSPGACLINFTTPEQNYTGWWHSHLIIRAAKAYAERCLAEQTLVNMYKNSGFSVSTKVIIEPLQGDYYKDITRVLDPSFRNADSLWAGVAEDEFAAAIATVEKVVSEGKEAQQAFFDKHDAWRKENGQSITLIATK
eukprot:TRINITY_DN544_c0_g1_i1.p1 TRINITY_DN544_c0_g1~~TRINITY_DN544_c0_g1_i1.p1  ORF type:complete len:290 (+),score=84.54 TRINITY_DN544_c0_g1_i1:54-923(+)